MVTSEQERRIIMQQAFEKQLHEQYAINNNSNWSSIVSLFAAIVAVFYGFGYIFVNSSVHFASSFEKLYCSCTKIYSLDVFLFYDNFNYYCHRNYEVYLSLSRISSEI